MGTGIDRARAGYEQTNVFTFTVEQIRTLNSLPVEMVPAPGVNMVALPISAIVAFKATDPPVAFGGSLSFGYVVGDINASSGISLDGTSSASGWDGDSVFTTFSLSNTLFNDGNMVNAAIMFKGDSDTTDGDGTLTIILTYRVIDLTGLI